MHKKLHQYVATWTRHGYADGLPDAVPDQLMHENLAPSYKAMALAILKCDHPCQSLGFTPKVSPWYSAIKKAEIARRVIHDTE